MKKWIVFLLALTLATFVLTSFGCKTNDSVDDPIAPPVEPPTMYTGNWSGTTMQSFSITFTVDGNNSITQLKIKINIGCATAETTYPSLSIKINADGSFNWTGGGETFSGQFASATSVAGTYKANGTQPCNYNITVTYTATKL